jgi:cytochrome o ubiquinol oxidase subunit II
VRLTSLASRREYRTPSARWRFYCTCASILLSEACQAGGVLDPRGPIASAERLILLNATGIMLVVVIPVIVATLGIAWWFRASNTKAAYRPNWAYSGEIELVVWAIPAMVVILLSGVAWIGAHDLDPAVKLKGAGPPIRIEVVSLDWKWLFIYPDQGIATVNELVIPAGSPIEFNLTSATVMNAFFVPQLGTQIYTMPGMTTHLNLMADQPGDYPGISSHYSGQGFSDMRFLVHALPAADFDKWLKEARAETLALNDDTYAQLAQPSSNVPTQTYGSVEATMYGHILNVAAPMTDAPDKEQ